MYTEDSISDHSRYILLPSSKRPYILIIFIHMLLRVDDQDVKTEKEMSLTKGKGNENTE